MKNETMNTEERPTWNVETEKAAFQMATCSFPYADRWVAGSGGTEEPTWSSRRGAWFVYSYNPNKQTHGWLNLSTDIVELEDPYLG